MKNRNISEKETESVVEKLEKEIIKLKEENLELKEELESTLENLGRYRILAEHSTDVVFQFKRSFINKSGLQCIYVSPIIEEFSGFSVSETLSLKPPQFLHPEDQAKVDEAFRMVIDKEIPVIRVRYRRKKKDDSYMWVESVGKLRTLDDQTSESLIVNMRDITEQVKIEEELNLSSKLASLGRLTAGIAHEIKNPLNYISGGKEALDTNLLNLQEIISSLMKEEKNDSNSELKNEIDLLFNYINKTTKSIDNGITKISDLIDGLKIYTRSKNKEFVLCNISDLFKATLIVVKERYHDVAEIIQQYGDLPPVQCNPGKINQVFDNLITNASQAIAERFKGEQMGTIIIETKTLKKNELVEIKISDNGAGIAKEDIDKIFEPFFTTKSVGDGTGLGLSICYSIIQEHKGSIRVISEDLELRGKRETFTSFIVTIPLNQNKV
ncbi:MAG: ATP-binding protein [Cyclobacteriaceae bacterium]|nr:ATP-binding protein [Cyclobacteriaceae bacterium]